MVGRNVSHYKILEQLGGGGMGIVYKAEDTRLGRIVALKFLPLTFSSDPEAKTRFIHEAKAASSLQHLNVCTIHDIDMSEEGQMFICMDFYDGESLKSRLERGALDVKEAVSLSIQVARGLAKAHEQGIVHRDIKPANIMVTTDGVAKIVDFGLAKLIGQSTMTRTGATLGTFAYMSPEQVRGEVVDHRTDIWSLGVVLYELLVGSRPFSSDYQQAVFYSILNDEPKPPRQINSAIPEPLEAIVLRALVKEPAERYQSAAELARDLEGMQAPPPAATRPRVHTFPRKLARPRIIVVSLLILAGIALTLFYVVPSAAVPFTGRDWIVVADFENSTGEEVFEKSLNTAFGISVEQSSYVNVMPRSRMADVLRRMKRADSQPVDEPTAREIALREELNLIVVPGISKVGTSYALTWKIEEVKEGETLKSGVIAASTSEDILPGLDEMSRTIRRTLGESRLSIARRGMQLTRVTTKSFEALKQYSLGIENHWKIDFEQARFHYAAALRLDSTFTSAKASLGMVCFEKFDTSEGKRYLSEAVQNLDGLTEKERYGILAFHARAVKNDFDLSIKNWQSLLELYPDYGVAHSNLGFLYFQLDRFSDAANEYKEAIRCDPTLYMTYYGLEWLYLYKTGEVDSTVAWSKRHLERTPDQAFVYDNLGYAYIGTDSLDQALAAFQKVVALSPRYIVGLYRLSDTYRMLGRYDEAVPPLEKVIELDTSDANAKYQLGVLYLLMKKKEKAATYLQEFRANADRLAREESGKGTHSISLGKVLILLGDRGRGWEIGQRGMAQDTSAHFDSAQLLSVFGRNQEAIDQLELAVKGGFRNYVWFKLHPDLWNLRNEPRFEQLLRRVLRR